MTDLHKMVNGVKVPLSAEEILEVQEREAAWAAQKAERDLAALRAKRDKELQASDWMMLPDTGLDLEKVMSYRKALRDLPELYTSVKDAVWPKKPV